LMWTSGDCCLRPVCGRGFPCMRFCLWRAEIRTDFSLLEAKEGASLGESMQFRPYIE